MGVLEVQNKEIRSFLLTPQTRIFYRIEKEHIMILTFFDTRQNSSKRPK